MSGESQLCGHCHFGFVGRHVERADTYSAWNWVANLVGSRRFDAIVCVMVAQEIGKIP